MITCAQLAQTLMGVNVADLARQTGIAEKTIYRLRHQKHKPSFDTLERLLAGVEALKRNAVDQKQAA